MAKKDKMTEQEKQHYRGRLLLIMINHAGKSKRIGMGELYEQVFGQAYEHRINDTRRLRTIITELRREGSAICSISNRTGGGYYIASADSELKDYCERLHDCALKKLAIVAKVRKISLPELLGQMRLDLRARVEVKE